MKITLYGKLGEAIGRMVALDDMPGRTVADLRRRLAELHPPVAADLLSPRVRVCVGDAIVGEDTLLSSEVEVSLLPPVSGG